MDVLPAVLSYLIGVAVGISIALRTRRFGKYAHAYDEDHPADWCTAACPADGDGPH